MPRRDVVWVPLALREEVDFILNETADNFAQVPSRADIKSIWVGLRPLVKSADDDGDNTKGLSREHTILVSRSGLVTVTGGKWTTNSAMAEDVLDRCFEAGLLPERLGGITLNSKLVGAQPAKLGLSDAPGLHLYGSDGEAVLALAGAETELCGRLTDAMVCAAADFDYARCVDDVLARRACLLL